MERERRRLMVSGYTNCSYFLAIRSAHVATLGEIYAVKVCGPGTFNAT
jgi:hypothetical protein